MANKSTGNRLTDAQRSEIRNAPPEATLADLAKKYNTSVNTVHRYRTGAKKATQPKEAAVKAAPKTSYLREAVRLVVGLSLSDSDLRTVLGSLIKA